MLSRREFLGSAAKFLGVVYAGGVASNTLLAYNSAAEISEEVRKQSEQILKPSTKAMFALLGLNSYTNACLIATKPFSKFMDEYIDLAIRFTRKDDVYLAASQYPKEFQYPLAMLNDAQLIIAPTDRKNLNPTNSTLDIYGSTNLLNDKTILILVDAEPINRNKEKAMWFSYLFYIYHELMHAFLVRVYRQPFATDQERVIHELISWASSLVLVGIVINYQNHFSQPPKSLIGIPMQVMELVNRITRAKTNKDAKDELIKFAIGGTNLNKNK